MANNVISSATTTLSIVANSVYTLTNNYAITISGSLAAGESAVINRYGSASVCNMAVNFSSMLYPKYAAGYSDVSADASGAMSYALLMCSFSSTTGLYCLINRAFYKLYKARLMRATFNVVNVINVGLIFIINTAYDITPGESADTS